MSRTKKQSGGVSNPIKATVTYKPNNGEFEIYLKESKKKISEVKSLEIIVLDADRFSITGYSNTYESMFTSNLVHNTKKEKLTVGTFVSGKYKVVAEGLYQDIKEKLVGGKYTKNVIGLLKVDGEFVLTDFQLTGTAKTIFMDWFQKENPDGLITITTGSEVCEFIQKTGEIVPVPKDKQKKWKTTWFYQLEFEEEEIDDKTVELADKTDEALQKYFDGSKVSTNVPSASEDGDEDGDGGDDDDNLPF